MKLIKLNQHYEFLCFAPKCYARFWQAVMFVVCFSLNLLKELWAFLFVFPFLLVLLLIFIFMCQTCYFLALLKCNSVSKHVWSFKYLLYHKLVNKWELTFRCVPLELPVTRTISRWKENEKQHQVHLTWGFFSSTFIQELIVSLFSLEQMYIHTNFIVSLWHAFLLPTYHVHQMQVHI